MGRPKYRQKKPLLGWCSGNKDNTENCFIQIGFSLLEHPSVQALTKSEYVLYFQMIKAAKGEREFTYPRSEYVRFFTPTTFHDAKNGLISKSFIELVYSGKCTREANRYKFVFGWKDNTEKR